jgi:DNA-binding transcriptional LysR family regulator
MAITLARLRSFMALAETRSFDRTAQMVGRSQPAVTEQIRSLEEALGVVLFHRQTRSVTLTPEGEVLFQRLGLILLELDTLVHDFSKIAALEVGEVRVGATPTLACHILPEVIGSFRKTHQGIRVLFASWIFILARSRRPDRSYGSRLSPRTGTSSSLPETGRYRPLDATILRS